MSRTSGQSPLFSPSSLIIRWRRQICVFRYADVSRRRDLEAIGAFQVLAPLPAERRRAFTVVSPIFFRAFRGGVTGTRSCCPQLALPPVLAGVGVAGIRALARRARLLAQVRRDVRLLPGEAVGALQRVAGGAAEEALALAGKAGLAPRSALRTRDALAATVARVGVAVVLRFAGLVANASAFAGAGDRLGEALVAEAAITVVADAVGVARSITPVQHTHLQRLARLKWGGLEKFKLVFW